MVAITKNNEIKTFPHADDLFHFAAEDFTYRAIAAINAKGVFTVALAGGNTPKFFFDALVENKFCKEKTPWHNIQFFFGDERYVPADNPANNYHMAYEHLFSKVSVPAENIYPIPTQFNNPQDAAAEYESVLKKVKFDLVYLGLGEDGHTASLMPDSDVVLFPTEQLVAALRVPQLKMYRITLTPAAINNAAGIIFLVTGTNKASAVYSVLVGPYEPQKYPAQLIRCENGKINWYLDQEAAGKLEVI